MFLSLLHVNVGDNPDRPRPGRLWLNNLYRVHQRLCMAFPSADRRKNDPDFLAPFVPTDFNQKLAATGDVHVTRGNGQGFLFRIDPIAGGSPIIMVQSTSVPDWEYAFHNAKFLLASKPEIRSFAPSFEVGRKFKFRLRANPVKSTPPVSVPEGARRKRGSRVPVKAEGLAAWLDRKADQSGFRVLQGLVTQTGWAHASKGKAGDNEEHMRYLSVLFDGRLEVIDSAKLCQTIASGVGPAKAFGFGMLSVAPL